MADFALTEALRTEYRQLWKTCVLRRERARDIDAIVDRIVRNKARYVAAGKPHGVPWHVVGIIHSLEGSGDFTTHLHNGDPLTARTVKVPRGRPAAGHPPFKWEVSAADALVFEGLDRVQDWSLTGTLFVFERFNGSGYRSRRINSPYLWSFSKHYTKGKFVGDGQFDPNTVSQQAGAAVLLFRMVARELTKVAAAAAVAGGPPPVDDGILRKGARGPAVKQLKVQLKRFFDVTSPGEWPTLGVSMKNDVFGKSLFDAVKIFQTRLDIEVDGQVGDETRKALRAKPRPPRPVKVADLTLPDGLKRGATGTKVRLLQGWLTLHDFGVAVDSSFLDATETALKRFQTKHGFPATGVIDRRTWNALVHPMLMALQPLPKKPALGSVVVAVAQQHLKQHPREAGGDNCGPWVRLYCSGQDGPGFLWCAGFVTFILKQACEMQGVLMPVKQTLLVDNMASSAGPKFVKGGTAAAIARLKPGSFFLVRGAPGDTFKYQHCGIIVSSDATTMDTIEGNTNDNGSSDGFEVCARTRNYDGKDFIVI